MLYIIYYTLLFSYQIYYYVEIRRNLREEKLTTNILKNELIYI